MKRSRKATYTVEDRDLTGLWWFHSDHRTQPAAENEAIRLAHQGRTARILRQKVIAEFRGIRRLDA